MNIYFTQTEFFSDINESKIIDTDSLNSIVINFFKSNNHTIKPVDSVWILNNKNKDAILLDLSVNEWIEEYKSGKRVIYRQPCFSVMLRLSHPSSLHSEPNISKCESTIYAYYNQECAISMLNKLLTTLELYA